MILGLDIGGTKTEAVLWDGTAVATVATAGTPSSLRSFERVLADLTALVGGQGVQTVGVGVAGVVDTRRQEVVASPNLGYLRGYRLGRLLHKLLPGATVAVANDARCFTFAELKVGQGRGVADFVGVTLGTGIGGGIVLGGRLFSGSGGNAGEIGHLCTEPGKDLERTFQYARRRADRALLAQTIGLLVADLANVLDVSTFIFGGGLSQALPEPTWRQAASVAKAAAVNPRFRPHLFRSRLAHAGAIGAALLASLLP